MLILTRRIGESVTINDNIRITALGVDGNQQKWGIEAPKNVLILRDEVEDNRQGSRRERDKSGR